MTINLNIHSDFNMMLLSIDLIKSLKNEGLKVKNIRRRDLPESLRKTICSFTTGKYIFVIIDDVANRYTSDEIEVILWHEYAHRYFNTDDEQLCDDFAITKVSKEAYTSAVKKSEELGKHIRQLYGIEERNVERYNHRNAVL